MTPVCSCGARGHHELDKVFYCCRCFDELIEHSGEIKFDLVSLANLASTGQMILGDVQYYKRPK